MTTPIDWITPKKLAEETGVSRSYIDNLLDSGEIKYSNKGKAKTSGIMISISSFNKYWEKKTVVK